MMMPKYIEDDIVKYNDKIMVIKEPRDGSHFDLFCPQEGSVYCLVDVEEIKPIPITSEILEKNRWKKKMYCDWCHYFPIEGNILYLSKGVGIDGAFSVDVGQGMSHIACISFVHQLQHLFFGFGLSSKMEV